MSKTIFQVFLILAFLTMSQSAFSQTITLNAECGKILEGEFTALHERQDVKIRLGAGDVLEVNIIPVGKYLKVRAIILDPAGAEIVNSVNGMFRTDKKSLIIKTETLSASGVYTLQVYDDMGSTYESFVGAYSAYFTCYKRNGEIIGPK